MIKNILLGFLIMTIIKTHAQVSNSSTKMTSLLPKARLDTIQKTGHHNTINYIEVIGNENIVRGWEMCNTKTGIPITRVWFSLDNKNSITIMFREDGSTFMIKENFNGIENRNIFFHENGLVQMIYYYNDKGLNGKHLVFDEQGNLETYSIYKNDKLKRVKFQKKK